tara:strand:- start:850 stop:1407 length:558 start_codon:yes stop_codon:yes gene_type:complete
LSNHSISSQSVKNSYSQALYELGNENKILEKLETETNSLINLFKNSKEFENFILNPISKPNDQIKVLNSLCEKYLFSDILKKFLGVLIVKRKLFFLNKILKDFQKICSFQRGEISGKLIVAQKLEISRVEEIRKKISNKIGSNIKLEYIHDPNLIGGLILKIESLMIDTSIKNKLKILENKLLEA